MSDFPPELSLSAGNIRGWSKVDKFGQSDAITTTPSPVTTLGSYRTPTNANGTKVRVKAGNVNDTVAGTGARYIFIQGIQKDTGLLVSELLPTNGISAGANSTYTYIRLFRAYVYESGTYADETSPSHAASIVIENAAGTEDWITIHHDGTLGYGQSQVACYTVPLGYEAYIADIAYSPATTKVINLYFFQRGGILNTSELEGMRLVRATIGLDSHADQNFRFPKGPFSELTDLGFMASVSTGTASLSVDFTILLRQIG